MTQTTRTIRPRPGTGGKLKASAIALVMATAPAAGAAHELPVGDGNVTSHPQVDNVYSCQTRFNGRGADSTGDWFHGDTWDPTQKPRVDGNVTWAQAWFSMTQTGASVDVQGNGLPVGTPTGTFPVDRDSQAYRYDRNPNTIRAQDIDFQIPVNPVRAAQPSCLPMGMIGISVTGVAFYNALDAAGRDAAAHEIQDLCDGHPQQGGQYHYHSASACLPGVDGNEVVGWALDGYPIMGTRGADGAPITNEDLDACHGRAETVSVDGRSYDYAYRLTAEYPYTIGCFVGQVQRATLQAVRAGMGQPANGTRQGPQNGGSGIGDFRPLAPQNGQRPPPPGQQGMRPQ